MESTLTKEMIEREIAASKAALKAHEEGQEIHKIVIRAFEEQLMLMKNKALLEKNKEEKK